jgi:hypothetical protein
MRELGFHTGNFNISTEEWGMLIDVKLELYNLHNFFNCVAAPGSYATL